jgi:hypothetical protein
MNFFCRTSLGLVSFLSVTIGNNAYAAWVPCGNGSFRESHTGGVWSVANARADWADANAACLSQGKRLPSVLEYRDAEVWGIRDIFPDFLSPAPYESSVERTFWTANTFKYNTRNGRNDSGAWLFNGRTGRNDSNVLYALHWYRCVTFAD